MKTKLIIHAGLAKTGTTSLQTFFHGNSYPLKGNYDVLYSNQFLHDVSAHHKLAMHIKSKNITELEKGLHNLSIESAAFSYAILTSEEISTLDKNQIRVLFESVCKYFTHVEVLFTVRPHYSLFTGSYKQQIREGFIRSSLTEFWLLARKHARFLDFHRLYEQWQSCSIGLPIDIVFVCTESMGDYDGNIVPLFFKRLGINSADGLVHIKKKENVSLSSLQTSFLKEISDEVPDLWREHVDWGHRRFVYYCFQNVSKQFKLLRDYEDSEFIANQIVIAENCFEYFRDDWESICSITNEDFPGNEVVYHWYDKKIKYLYETIGSTHRETAIFQDSYEESKSLISTLYLFYQNHGEIKALGPSEQVAYYKAHTGSYV